ncbi:MAG TPA: 2-dehydropantoate 2-reductase [Chloroflexaceae bacterium]|nr:2-dehydropantoate 2-reductase [Chloroflexaceae bacterium]
MRFAIIGVGGVGGYFGGRLAEAGHEVYLLARGAHLAAIRAEGLRVLSPLGDFTARPAGATDSPAKVGPVDVVLVGVKAWQLPEAAPSLAPLIGPATAVVPLLNGVEAAEIVAGAVGREHTMGGLCRISAALEAPGVIRHVGMEPSVVFGELDNSRTPRAEALLAALAGAGVRASIAADIAVATWEKFMLICAWSGLGAVTRAPIGVWRALPETRALAEQVVAEVAAVARARGVAVPPGAEAATLAFIDGVPPGGLASLQRDLVEGRPSELEAQSGAVVRLGRDAGVPTPASAFIYAALLPQERAARGEG